MKIGILGGTFDPPHIAHLAIAKHSLEQLSLDEILFIPTYKTPGKERQYVTPASKRLKMVDFLIKDESHISLSDIEVTREGISYTIDTLEELFFASPANYWLIMGSDTLLTLPSWKQSEKLMKMCRLAVCIRDHQAKEDLLAQLPTWVCEKIDFIETVEPVKLNISSTKIREMFARKITPHEWLNEGLTKYILEKKIYTY
jgi:nicotinate-nucleotide adenylyltransferase